MLIINVENRNFKSFNICLRNMSLQTQMLLQRFVMNAYSVFENKLCKSVCFVKHIIINCRINLSFTAPQIYVLCKCKGSQDVYGFYRQFFAFSVTIKLTSEFKIIKFRNEHRTLTIISIPAIFRVRQAT